MMRKLMIAAAWAASSGAIFACGAGPTPLEQKASASRESLETTPSSEAPTQLVCGQAVTGSGAHEGSGTYMLPVEAGRRYTLVLDTDDPVASMTALAAEGQRLASDRDGAGEPAILAFSAQRADRVQVRIDVSPKVGGGRFTLRTVCEIAGMNELEPGQEVFRNLEPAMFRPGGIMFDRAGNSIEVAASSAPRETVEEADIYKLVGSRLYYLNGYRGFLTVDLANPREPRVLGRLALRGYPVEMFVEGNVVHALLRDAVTVRGRQGEPLVERRHTSQLVTIDVADPRAPRMLGVLDIQGDLREGVSRRVGDSMYVVSSQTRYGWYSSTAPSREDAAWVYSFDVSDPRHVRRVDALQVFQGSTQPGSPSSERWFQDIALSATPDALLVAENWQTYRRAEAGGSPCVASESNEEAVVSVIDIRDPKGKIRRQARFTTEGRLTDQFKQTYSVDPKTGRATYFGILAHRSWVGGCTSESRVENALESWDVTVGKAPRRLDRLTFGKPNELVRGSVFDLARGVVFAITAQMRDPLYALRIDDPADLRIASAVDGLSGDMNVFRFIGGHRFLLAVGQDTSDACTGFDGPSTGFSSRVAASVIDVRKLDQIRLVQRKCVTVAGAPFVSSEVNWNLDQAHKLIGVHEEDDLDLVTVPVSYVRRVDEEGRRAYRSETAVAMMRWDLSRYDDTADERHQSVLEDLGTVLHPEGTVRRTLVFTPPQGLRRQMATLSESHLALADIGDLNRPVREGSLELAPDIAAVLPFGACVVEQVRPSWQAGEEGVTTFRVKRASASLDDEPVLESFTLAGVESVVPLDGALAVARRGPPTARHEVGPLEVQAWDFSSPCAPRRGGSVRIPTTWFPYNHAGDRESASSLDTWGGADLVVEGATLVMLARSYGPGDRVGYALVSVGLEDPQAPVLRTRALPAKRDTELLGLTADVEKGRVYVAERRRAGTEELEGFRFEEMRYGATPWVLRGNEWSAAGSTVSLPGRLFRVEHVDGRRVLLTHDTAYEVTAERRFRGYSRLHVLTAAVRDRADVARLGDTAPLYGQRAREATVDPQRLTARVEPAAFDVFGDIVFARGLRAEPASRGDELWTFDLGSTDLRRRDARELGTEGLRLLGAREGTVFGYAVGEGLYAFQVDDGRVRFDRFVRTLGYDLRVAFDEARLFGAAGPYGTYTVPLTSGPPQSGTVPPQQRP